MLARCSLDFCIDGWCSGTRFGDFFFFYVQGFVLGGFWHNCSVLGGSLGSLGASLGSLGRPKGDLGCFGSNSPLTPPPPSSPAWDLILEELLIFLLKFVSMICWRPSWTHMSRFHAPTWVQSPGGVFVCFFSLHLDMLFRDDSTIKITVV